MKLREVVELMGSCEYKNSRNGDKYSYLYALVFSFFVKVVGHARNHCRHSVISSLYEKSVARLFISSL